MARPESHELSPQQIAALTHITLGMITSQEVGYVTRGSLKRALKDTQYQKEAINMHSSDIIGALKRQTDELGNTWEGFKQIPIKSTSAREEGAESDTTIYYNSGLIDENEAIRRFRDDTLARKEETERADQARKDQAAATQREIAVQREAQKPPAKTYLCLVPYRASGKPQDQELSDYVTHAMNSHITNRITQEIADQSTQYGVPLNQLIPEGSLTNPQPLTAFGMLKKGATQDQLDQLIDVARQKVIIDVRVMEDNAPIIAQDILDRAKTMASQRRGVIFFAPAFMQRQYVPLIKQHLERLVPVDGQVVMEGVKDPFFPLLTYQEHLLNAWLNRYDASKLPSYLQQIDETTGTNTSLLREVLAVPNALSRIQQGESIALANNSIITRENMDKLLAPLVLDKTQILRGILADVMRVGFLDHRHHEGGTAEEFGMGLRLFTEKFSPDEIIEIFRFRHEHEFTDPIHAAILDKVEKAKAEEKESKGKRPPKMKPRDIQAEERRLLGLRNVTALKEERNKALFFFERQVYIRIATEVTQRVTPLDGKKPVDYSQGAASIAYQQQVAMYNKLQAEGKFAMMPNPDDFQPNVDGKIPAFYQDFTLLRTITSLKPNM